MSADQQNRGKIQGRPENLTNAGKGRAKGVPNKTTTLLKDALLEAATKAGGNDALGIIGTIGTIGLAPEGRTQLGTQANFHF